MQRKISIIIPSRDEGEEPLNTVKSLFASCKPSQVDVIIVDDSWMRQDWSAMPKSVRVVKTGKMKGFGVAIQKGIDAAKHENLFITGARTRFSKGFISKSLKALKEPGIYCGVSAILRYDQTDIEKAEGLYYGASIKRCATLTDSEAAHWLGWILNYGNREEPEGDDIECAYGGHYITTKSWWNHIHGLTGIQTRGGCNQFLSLKTRGAGGNLKIIKDMVIGNIYRDRCPYPVGPWEPLYNRAFIMSILLGYKHGRKVLDSYIGRKEYEMVRLVYDRKFGEVATERHHYLGIRKQRIRFNN